jgi:2-succinyl-5-enolpyruvyl-6-hydroxy-3-cyclohexene-1-carboxylate synthase
MAGPTPDSHAALAFARVLFEELVRAGVEHVCLCPGSRSTPLVVAAEQCGARLWTHLDERAGGFFALGLSRTTRRPTALICTSGTAAANFLPAVIEAFYARVPLVVLTADRPPELRGWGAGQTIDQIGLFGRHIRWFVEAPVPVAGESFERYGRALGSRAVATAQGSPPGPVHLNLPFREPLEPAAAPGGKPIGLRTVAARPDGEPYTRWCAQASPPPDRLVALLAGGSSSRGVVLCGPQDHEPTLPRSIARLARALSWPVIADPVSQLRFGPHVNDCHVVSHADLFLRVPSLAGRLDPDIVVRFGAPPTSKAVRRWVERHADARIFLVDGDAIWEDPLHRAAEVVHCDPGTLCTRVAERIEAERGIRAGQDWLDRWLRVDGVAGRILSSALDGQGALLEGSVARTVAANLPDDSSLFLSNSMPVRDVDAFASASHRRIRVYGNRGASGIDGINSTALGIAAGGEGPLVVLSGDLAFLHDLSGLLAIRRHDLRATFIVLNNGGGGIFEFLPIAAFGEAVGFERNFVTPHETDLRAVAELAGMRHEIVADAACLRGALAKTAAADEPLLFEIPIDRLENVAQHREIVESITKGLEREGLA